jgi:hypothetical protein
MPRLVQALVAIALFVGVGVAGRHYFPLWLNAKLEESSKFQAKEMEKWKPVETQFSNVKIDQPLILVPTYDPSQTPGMPGRR